MLGYVCWAKQGLHLQHLHINTHTQPTIPPFTLTKGLIRETLSLKLFTVANLLI